MKSPTPLLSFALAVAVGPSCLNIEPFSTISTDWVDCQQVAILFTQNADGTLKRQDFPCSDVHADPGSDTELRKACEHELAQPAGCDSSDVPDGGFTDVVARDDGEAAGDADPSEVSTEDAADGADSAGGPDDTGMDVPTDCSHLDGPCTVGMLAGGTCVAEAMSGEDCDDGDPCTADDVCDLAGQCNGAAIDCSVLSDECNVGLCASGACVKAPLSDGTACDDGDFCTADGVCEAGLCVDAPDDSYDVFDVADGDVVEATPERVYVGASSGLMIVDPLTGDVKSSEVTAYVNGITYVPPNVVVTAGSVMHVVEATSGDIIGSYTALSVQHSLFPSGKTVYMSSNSPFSGAPLVTALSVASPDTPALLGAWTPPTPGSTTNTYELLLRNNYLYAAAGEEGVRVFDVTSVSDIGETNTVPLGTVPYEDVRYLDGSGLLLYAGALTVGVWALQLTDPTTPQVVSHTPLNLFDLKAVGTQLYVALGAQGMQRFDFANAANPTPGPTFFNGGYTTALDVEGERVFMSESDATNGDRLVSLKIQCL